MKLYFIEGMKFHLIFLGGRKNNLLQALVSELAYGVCKSVFFKGGEIICD